MAVSYKKLWKLLIDRDLKKKDLEEMRRSAITRSINSPTATMSPRMCWGGSARRWTARSMTLWSLWMSRLASTVLKFSRAHIQKRFVLGRNHVYG